MLHVPILRAGRPYRSVDRAVLTDHMTGRPVAEVSQANMGMLRRDALRIGDPLADIPAADLLAGCRKAADLFISAEVPVGDAGQTFDDYIAQLSATTGMPLVLCRSNAEKIRTVLAEIDQVVGGLTRGLDLAILDRGHGTQAGHVLAYKRQARTFGAVLPNNSPGVHSLWIPAVAFKAALLLKPGGREPWTPLRVIEALAAAGVPREAFGFYPGGHGVGNELLLSADRAMLFGGDATLRPWQGDPRIELHGTGYSKVILGDDAADDWEQYLDVMVASILANGGRSCVNASAVWTPRHGDAIADALADRLATVRALPPDDPEAKLAAFTEPAVAEAMSGTIDAGLAAGGAIDKTAERRGPGRLVRGDHAAWLLPTIVRCDRAHALANREFLFPYASVVECPIAEMLGAIGPTLAVSAITRDEGFIGRLMACPDIDRLNVGPIETWRVRWDQPHEGNLFELLYRQRALQLEPAS